MASRRLTVEEDARGVLRLTMSRPEAHNAFDEAMIGELAEAFRGPAAAPSVRIVVLAAGGRHFSAGADLDWMRRASAAPEEWNLADALRFADMLWAIADCGKPTIARIQGSAFGGGVGLACACDLAIAAADARFAVSEAKFGILPAVIGPYLIAAVGPRQATRLALTAARIDAAEALALGLVHRLAAPAELDAAIDAAIAELLACGPAAQGEIKRLYRRLGGDGLSPEARDLTARTIGRVRGTDEAREGFAAFFEKRPPAWAAR